MWNQNPVITVKGWDPRVGEGGLLGSPQVVAIVSPMTWAGTQGHGPHSEAENREPGHEPRLPTMLLAASPRQ